MECVYNLKGGIVERDRWPTTESEGGAPSSFQKQSLYLLRVFAHRSWKLPSNVQRKG